MRVAILQPRLFHYRLRMFALLREELGRHGVETELVHGQASAAEALRHDEGSLPWATKVHNRFFRLFGRDVLWLPLPHSVHSADLVVMVQENRILSNYLLLLKRRLGGPRIAYWGHGRNFQSLAPSGLREKWKAFLLSRVDWWFAYTDLTVELLTQRGYPPQRITNLQNAIDVSYFQRELSAVSDADIEAARCLLGIDVRARVGIFCGSLYAEKRIGLMLAAADLIRQAVPDFHLIVIGDGPSAAEVRTAAVSRPWIHVLGVRTGQDKAVMFRLAQVQLNPGLVGLHVLDAFSAGLPMIATATALHSPEIAYLLDGQNGVITARDDAAGYAESVIGLLADESARLRLSQRCLADAQRYTVENMVHNFCGGILECLHTCCGKTVDAASARPVERRA